MSDAGPPDDPSIVRVPSIITKKPVGRVRTGPSRGPFIGGAISQTPLEPGQVLARVNSGRQVSYDSGYQTQDELEGGGFPSYRQASPCHGSSRREWATEEVSEPCSSAGSAAAAQSPLPDYDTGDEGDISTFVPDTHTTTDHDIPKVEKDDDQIRTEETG